MYTVYTMRNHLYHVMMKIADFILSTETTLIWNLKKRAIILNALVSNETNRTSVHETANLQRVFKLLFQFQTNFCPCFLLHRMITSQKMPDLPKHKNSGDVCKICLFVQSLLSKWFECELIRAYKSMKSRHVCVIPVDTMFSPTRNERSERQPKIGVNSKCDTVCSVRGEIVQIQKQNLSGNTKTGNTRFSPVFH